MYSRSYYPEGSGKVTLPDNYDGTAFMERESAPPQEETAEVSFIEGGYDTVDKRPDEEESVLTGIGRVPFLSGIFGKGGILGGLNLKMPRIGTEEILILATAAFLFFSRDGDKESALILLLLLLIN